ncbi:uncharacterized protein K452DRAFT_165984 [Aplosporella prunicola CBS 121167]|uniref:Uncharacterized protein n=1 Tax=Aplosporella prunicola CBS 121167 TaxID=1176127 RepID=A0A6A6AUJ6_9PEZI|nr:uncharacterized protein K452DRAFT_173320 [Aplosporella prunicola CBS 121167]XP_033391410.1 uncharacterized protein K452DRAFT_165984 [Aplosporella prunicola CBS 121167]KAF2135552.1 hypothetical protein K452DRAFT_173320 [Aplosporella prunicola CBS 121167]KAF2135692.1 hypothetical protein K452DRAFT_165984 [Aplosporella prunicola CBS 121167]
MPPNRIMFLNPPHMARVAASLTLLTTPVRLSMTLAGVSSPPSPCSLSPFPPEPGLLHCWKVLHSPASDASPQSVSSHSGHQPQRRMITVSIPSLSLLLLLRVVSMAGTATSPLAADKGPGFSSEKEDSDASGTT